MVDQLITERDWNNMVPRSNYYSYGNFIDAVREMSDLDFLSSGGRKDKKRELAAFLANAAHETGNFQYVEEINKGKYQEPHAEYPPNPRCYYYGRGPLQLSWNYNYGAFSKECLGNKNILLDHPNQVAENGALGFMSAIWFWCTQPNVRRSAHSGIYKNLCQYSNWGFGRTIMAINGGLEGNAREGGSSNKDQQVTRRIRYYRKFAGELGIEVGENGEQLDTRGM